MKEKDHRNKSRRKCGPGCDSPLIRNSKQSNEYGVNSVVDVESVRIGVDVDVDNVNAAAVLGFLHEDVASEHR